MSRFDYFTGASRGWRARVSDRLDEAVIDRGAGVGAYIDQRIAAAPLFSYERRRWALARSLLKARKR